MRDEIRLLDPAGREIPGEYFRTGFDMTVVLHPAATITLREGMTVRAAWRVSDRLGREGSGVRDFILARYDHRDDRPLSPPQVR